jgi:putative DNA methylase
MTYDDRRLIEDYLPIEAISAEASREKSVRKGHISTLHLWWARRPLVACRAAVYGALVPASRFIPENGPDNKKQSLTRANAAKFVERLCKYPGNSEVIREAQEHILEAHAERLSQETGKPVTVEDIVEGRAPRPKVWTCSPGVERFRWKRCVLGATPTRSTSTPWRTSSSSVRLSIRRSTGNPSRTHAG